MTTPETNSNTQNRLKTGLPGLDTLLNGGFIEGGMYLFLGPPGSGKTVLGNQICFNHIKAHGGNVVYITLLAESHTRMMLSLREFDYFDGDRVGRTITYLSGYHALEKDGLKGLLRQIAETVREKNATLLMIDGITTIGDIDQSALAFRRFTHELNGYLTSTGCTSFLLSSMEGHHSNPEHTMVDGIICLHHQNIGLRADRQIEVRKFRGSAHSLGKHFFSISERGLTILPRLESLATPAVKLENRAKTRSLIGVPSLDQMLGGGLASNSITTVVGAAGVGKTLLGLHFLQAGAELNEPGLYFGFYESPNDLVEKSHAVKMDFSKSVKKGIIEILWRPAIEQSLDELGDSLLQTVKQSKIKRVVIDGVDGFRRSTLNQKRLNRFFIALVIRLKALGATVFIIEETSLASSRGRTHIAEHSGVNENLLFLRYAQKGSRIRRLISILKMRSSAYDSRVREFQINENGIKLLDPLPDQSSSR